MCHLTEIPPMRRIDLQPDIHADRNARRYIRASACVCVWVAGSVGADSRNRWCEFCSPAKKCEHRRGKIYLLPRPSRAGHPKSVAINTARRIDNRYRWRSVQQTVHLFDNHLQIGILRSLID